MTTLLPPRSIAAALDIVHQQYALPLTTQRSLAQLSAYRSPITLHQAQTQIAAHWEHIILLALYQHIFPDVFAASTASFQRNEDDFFSPREWEFLELVDRHRFPVDLDQYSIEEERHLQIPLCPCGLSLYDDGDPRPGWGMLAFLAGHFHVSYVRDLLTDQPPAVMDLLIAGDAALPRIPDPEDFARLSASIAPPLVYLAPALDMLLHRTTTFWLDADAEQPLESVSWSREMIELLSAEWHTAQRVMRQADIFLDWLEADPLLHLPEVITLWTSALRLPA